MRALKALALLCFVLVLGSCKHDDGDRSALRDDTTPGAQPDGPTQGPSDVCPCADMQCWRKATNDGVKDQVSCAKDAIEKVVPVVGPMIDIAETLVSIDDGVQGLKEVTGIAKQIIEARNAGSGFPNELSCLVDIANTFQGAAQTLEQFGKASKLFVEGPSYDAAKAMGDMLKAAYDGVNSFMKIIGRGNCTVDPTKKELKVWHERLEKLKTKPTGVFSSFIKRSEDIVKTPIDKINVARTIYSCGAKIFKGARTLYHNTQCLMDDLKALEDSKRAVARSLAYVGSRQYNHARYIGCKQCVYSSWKDSTATEYQKCRNKCEAIAPHWMQRYQKASWVTSCQLTCGVARTEGLFWDYTDEAVCNEVKNMFHVSRIFRQIPLVPPGTPEAEERGVAENRRANVLAALNQLDQFFIHVPGLHDSPAGAGVIEPQDLVKCRDNTGFHRELRDACGFFADERNKPLYDLMETASGHFNLDGLAAQSDIRYFRDEVGEYRDDSEHERADVTGNLNACADWGRDAGRNEGWGCDWQRAYNRCQEHADHRSSTIANTRPLRQECTFRCVQSTRATNGCQ